MITRVIQTKINMVLLEDYKVLLREANLSPELIRYLEMMSEKQITLPRRFPQSALLLSCQSGSMADRFVRTICVLCSSRDAIWRRNLNYETAFRILVFAHVAHCSMIINPIPFFRDLVFLIHWIILLTIGFKHLGQITTGKAILLALSTHSIDSFIYLLLLVWDV